MCVFVYVCRRHNFALNKHVLAFKSVWKVSFDCNDITVSVSQHRTIVLGGILDIRPVELFETSNIQKSN